MSEGKQEIELLGGDVSISPVVAAAHELKAPLALVRQLSLLLQQDTGSDDERQILLNRITVTSERALRLTSDITKAARLEDALFELEPINPRQVCEEVVTELSALFTAHGRQLEVKGQRHPLLLVANRDLLRRIVLSFSDNALHYSDAGSPVVLRIQSLRRRDVVRIGVRDYGPALSSDVWRRLRQQMPQPVHLRPQSSGLGLTIARRFAEAMGGTVGAVRHRDGATFYVELQTSRQMSLL